MLPYAMYITIQQLTIYSVLIYKPVYWSYKPPMSKPEKQCLGTKTPYGEKETLRETRQMADSHMP